MSRETRHILKTVAIQVASFVQILITGASKGIDAGIARELAAAGEAVVVNYASDRTGAQSAVDAVAAAGGRAIAVQADVAKAADVIRLFEQTKETFGSLDILVNNAGVFQAMPVTELTEEEFHREINTKLNCVTIHQVRANGTKWNIACTATSRELGKVCLLRH